MRNKRNVCIGLRLYEKTLDFEFYRGVYGRRRKHKTCLVFGKSLDDTNRELAFV